jgi:hypothetical protein
LFITTYQLFSSTDLILSNMAFVNSVQLKPIWLPNLILLRPLFARKVKLILFIFDLSSAFDLVPHNILLHKLSNFGLSSSYVDWFLSYLDNRRSSVCISVTLSFSFLESLECPKVPP